MTKVMLILSSISSGLEFWLVNHTSIYKNSGLKLFKNIKFLVEIYKFKQVSWILSIIIVDNTTME